MRARRGFWLNDPWYTDWVLLTAAVLGVIVGVCHVATYYSGAGVISPLAIVDFLFAFVVTTAFWGLVLLLIRWIVRKAAHTPGGATQPGRTPAKSAVRVRVAGGTVRFTPNPSLPYLLLASLRCRAGIALGARRYLAARRARPAVRPPARLPESRGADHRRVARRRTTVRAT